MKKINILKNSADYNRIIKKNKGIKNRYFIINYETNNCNIPKFGITISKKQTTAVQRNRIKRQVKNIIDKNKKIYKKDKIYIIIIRKEALSLKYNELEVSLINLFNKIEGELNEKI